VSDPKDDKDWAGKGFGKRNAESAKPPEDQEDPDNEEWAWK
jgi:hypothetical protein